MNLLLVGDLGEMFGALWNGYVVLLHATAYWLGAALLSPLAKRYGPGARATVHAASLIGMLVVSLVCWLPGGWWMNAIPGFVAAPLIYVGAAAMENHFVAAATDLRLLIALYAVWVAGTVIIIGRAVLAWMAMWRLVARSQQAPADWNVFLGTERRVEIRVSRDVPTPVVWGVLDPVIVLPESSAHWSEEYLRAVLMHETAHVSRSDGLVQLVGQVAQAWYWFHPAVWWTRRQLAAAREEACDARVVAAGVRPSDYARVLLDLSDGVPRSGLTNAAAIPFAVRDEPSLLRRSRRILAGAPARRATRGTRLLLATVIIAWMGVWGTVRLAPVRSAMWAALESPSWTHRAYAASVLSRSKYDSIRARTAEHTRRDPNPFVRRFTPTR